MPDHHIIHGDIEFLFTNYCRYSFTLFVMNYCSAHDSYELLGGYLTIGCIRILQLLFKFKSVDMLTYKNEK